MLFSSSSRRESAGEGHSAVQLRNSSRSHTNTLTVTAGSAKDTIGCARAAVFTQCSPHYQRTKPHYELPSNAHKAHLQAPGRKDSPMPSLATIAGHAKATPGVQPRQCRALPLWLLCPFHRPVLETATGRHEKKNIALMHTRSPWDKEH